MIYDIVIITWLDAVSRDHWENLDEPLPPAHITSCGYLIGEDKNYYTLAVNIDMVNNYSSCTMTIPKGMVENVQVVKEVNKPKAKRTKAKPTDKREASAT